MPRQERRRKKRLFALSAMCVTSKNPTGVFTPANFIHRVGIMNQNERGIVGPKLWQDGTQIETASPQFVWAIAVAMV